MARQSNATQLLKKVRGIGGIWYPATLIKMTEKDQTTAEPAAYKSPTYITVKSF
jgi:hypothetical protein